MYTLLVNKQLIGRQQAWPPSRYFRHGEAPALALGVAALVLSAAGMVAAQKCGCRANECCSRYGYCGTTDAYCGDGCKSGPCSGSGGGGGGGGGGSGVSVQGVVTKAFFNGIKSRAGNGCAGKSFYTRRSFLAGARANPNFGKGRTTDDAKREIAAFFAHVTHETGHMCYIEEIGGARQNYCDDRSHPEWPCTSGKGTTGADRCS
ncbi:hypothetical protein ZWY2020_011246 [Hordeum vulgare]|nr:hypothetical protein ZWY2020_011246 [Hordeum vulgare]